MALITNGRACRTQTMFDKWQLYPNSTLVTLLGVWSYRFNGNDIAAAEFYHKVRQWCDCNLKKYTINDERWHEFLLYSDEDVTAFALVWGEYIRSAMSHKKEEAHD